MEKENLKILIGKQIIIHRKKKGWNQSDLARACSKDRQAIEKIENGKVNPTIFTIYEIALALDVKLSQLLNFD